jgi:acetyl esterase/lipase
MGDDRWTRRDLLRTGLFGASFVALSGTGLLTACGDPSANNIAFEIEQIPYGPDPMQVGELSRPLLDGARPVVVLVHGGYWRVGFTRTAMDDLASDLARVGFAAWNLDYRRFGELGGGWPGTVEDVAAGIDHLAEIAPAKDLDLDRVAVIGHSAGGQLAIWACARGKASATSPGAAPVVHPKGVVSLAGVVDLVRSAKSTEPGGGVELRRAIEDFLAATPEQSPTRYAEASPMALLPIGVPQLILHGSSDDRVPVEQSRDYAAAATASGDPTEIVEVEGADHFQVIESTTAWWDRVVEWLVSILGDPLDRDTTTTSTTSLPAS